MYDKVREIEKQLASSRAEMESLQKQLADENLYTDSKRQSELTELVQALANAKSNVEALEWEWLEASEALEKSS
jgi:hypothetical protein